MKTLIELIAYNCEWWKTVTPAYQDMCDERIAKLEGELPSGSGIDCGCKIDRKNSGQKKVVIQFSFHHMDEMGGYCGWTEHKCIITPNLHGYPDIKITGRNRDNINDYLNDVLTDCLCCTQIDESTFYQE